VKISVLAFDLSDNATGRADLLARLLAPKYEVAVIGPRFGPAVWAPAQGSAVEQRAVPASRHLGVVRAVPSLLRLIDGDLIYASKPRPTSFGIGLLARARRPRPLLLDIDDWELGFYRHVAFSHRLGRALRLADANGMTWTWLLERQVRRADALTVASRFLQERFGGTLLPHVRDTEAWDPARFDRAAARARLGVGAAKLVMFLGTPRGYKGIDDLVEAVGLLDDVRLAVVGVNLATADARRWAALPFVTVVGKIPFDDVPRYLVAADVVAIPQRATTATLGQVPAKLFDAMALGRPIVSTAVSMIPEILDGCGELVPPGDVRALAAALRRLLDDPARAAVLGRRARERCEALYSFTAARATLFPLVERVLAGGPAAHG
jgi:glycosyltransferase involved in cell wall biosynthesis